MGRPWVALFPAGCLALAGCYGGLETEGALGSGSLSGGDAGDAGEDGGDDDDGGDDGGPQGLCGDADVGINGLRRLTAVQYDNTIRDLLGITSNPSAGFSADERVGPFKANNAAPVGELQVEQYMGAAETIAAEAVGDMATLLPCDPVADGEDACAQAFVEDVGARAYRRPLTTGELTGLMAVYDAGKAEDGFANGIRVALGAILQSPYFIYRIEFGLESGGDVVALTDHEVATRLSYFLWNTMPDDTLFSAADAGELTTTEGLAAQVDRMLGDPRTAEAVASFHTQWLGVDEIELLEKDATDFPNFTPALAAAMKEEAAAFTEHVILGGDGRLETLLSAPMTITDDAALLDLYGVQLPAGHQPGDPVDLPVGERAGLLTQAGLLASAAHADQSSPILRGVLVRQNFFCQILPVPPPDVDNVPPDPEPGSTTRERFRQHTEDPACAGCHVLIDPIGFGLENYDAVGQYRTMEGTLPVDSSGELVSTDVDGPFNGGVELANMMATSNMVRECVASQWFSYAFGRPSAAEDECTTDHINEAFAESDYDIRVLLREIAVSDSFRFRRAE